MVAGPARGGAALQPPGTPIIPLRYAVAIGAAFLMLSSGFFLPRSQPTGVRVAFQGRGAGSAASERAITPRSTQSAAGSRDSATKPVVSAPVQPPQSSKAEKRACARWGCTCRGFSDVFGAFPGEWGRAPRAEEGRETQTTEQLWWVSAGCQTYPEHLTPEPLDPTVVSILSFSNGQPYLDENLLLNAMYQQRPEGIKKIELLVWYTSPARSVVWRQWQRRFQSDTFTIRLHWFNASEPPSSSNPTLGTKRNLAMFAASGHLMVNMDNDDVYHPNYIRFVSEHLKANNATFMRVMRVSAVQFNPDGSFETVRQAVNAHAAVYSLTSEILRKGCVYAGIPAGEEAKIRQCWANGKARLVEVDASNGTWGNPFLYTRISSPLSIVAHTWHIGVARWNRLSAQEVGGVIAAQQNFYRNMHALLRPVGSPDYPPITGDESSSPLAKIPDWTRFHKVLHPKFFNDTAYPVCKGFAGLPGEVVLPEPGYTVTRPARDSAECCEICASMFDPAAVAAVVAEFDGKNKRTLFHDNVTEGFCGVWTYAREAKSCQLGFGSSGKVLSAPWLWRSHETGIRIAPTCPGCGHELKPDPPYVMSE